MWRIVLAMLANSGSLGLVMPFKTCLQIERLLVRR